MFGKYIFLLALLLPFFNAVHAQDRSTGPTGDQCIRGTVTDSVSGLALANASLEFTYRGQGPLPATMRTDSAGRFNICVSNALRSLKVTLTGFNETTVLIPVTADSIITLSPINLRQSVVSLSGATAKAKKESEPITIEKKTYSVSQNILATGGTAIDALKQVPAVNVDNDGNISLRGSSNITIYINGKQSSLSGNDRQALLMQIPAANIESIEVNTNPGAKQDAEGQSGIINITLKQNTSKTKNGNVTLGAGTHNKYNGTATFNTGYKKFIFGHTLSFRQNDQWGRGYNLRTNAAGVGSNQINQFSNGDYLTVNSTFSGVTDYYHSKKLTISANYLFSYNQNNEQELSRNELRTLGDSLYQLIHRNNVVLNKTLNYDAGLMVKKTFKQPAHNLIALVNYSSTAFNGHTDITQNELNSLNEEIKSVHPYLLFLENMNAFRNQLVQVDYTRPYNQKLKMETGAKYTGRKLDNNFVADSVDHITQLTVNDFGKSNHFIYEENVSAAYAMITHTLNPIIKYNAGLRAENTAIKGNLVNGGGFDYSYLKFFPSGSLNFTLQKKYKLPDVQISYSRRINRPGQWQLNPFASYTDPYNLSKGNPKLRPELTDAVEVSAIYDTRKTVFTATFYARQTNQPIYRYRTIDTTGISTVSYYNLNYNRSMGGELVARFSIIKDLKVTLNANLYKFVVAGNISGNSLVNTRLTYSGKANVSYQFWKKTDVQASFNYMGPFVTPQGTGKPMFGLEIGGRKDIIKDKLTMSLNLADVFNTRRFAMTMNDPMFTSSFYRKRESRILTFTLTWKFGASDAKVPERKPRQQEQGNPMDF